MNYNIIDLNHIETCNILHINWDTKLNNFYIVKKVKNTIIINAYDGKRYSLVKSLVLKSSDIEKVYDLKFFEELNVYCISSGISIILFDNKGIKIKECKRAQGVISAKYVSKKKVFLELYEFSGCRSLGVWDLEKNQISEYELEDFNHYNRSFKIHPINRLLYGTANAYECGMHIHILDFQNKKLKFIKEEKLYCHRDEIECYSLNINSIGDEFIMIVDPDHGKLPSICLYSIYEQQKPKSLIRLHDYHFYRTSFLLDKYILVQGVDTIVLINPNDQKKGFSYEKILKDEEKLFTFNNSQGKFIFTHKGILKVCELIEEKSKMNPERVEKMNQFIEKAFNNGFKTVEVGEYYE